MNAKPFKVGDNVYAGMVLAEMPDLTTLLMDAKVEEIDRGRIAANQEVQRPRRFAPRTHSERHHSTRSRSSPKPATNCRPSAASAPMRAIPKPDPRLRPGMNGGMDIIINRIPNAISIPSKALFTHAGKPIVYVAENGRYHAGRRRGAGAQSR